MEDINTLMPSTNIPVIKKHHKKKSSPLKILILKLDLSKPKDH